MKKKPILGVVIAIALTALIVTCAASTATTILQSTHAVIDRFGGTPLVELEPEEKTPKRAPIATSGNNVYLVWPSNKTGDFEILFRASSDGGKTFGPKINLSNSTGVNSVDQEIAATANSVYITWWDVLQNGTRTPMFIASNDNGKTFGQKLMINRDIAAAGSSSP
jgi:hypothetical protein